MMNPTVGDKIIDTACGSSGFTVHSIFKVWKDIRREKGLPEGEGFTAAQRVPEETILCGQCVLPSISMKNRPRCPHAEPDCRRWADKRPASEYVGLFPLE